MHKDLEDWLNAVWDRRDELLRESKKQGFFKGRGASAGINNEGVGRIYDMYNEPDSSAASSSDTNYLTALKGQLVELERQIGQPPEVQIGSNFTDWLPGAMANAREKALKDRFFHYRRIKNSPTIHRIYVNALLGVRGEVFREILVGLWNVKGLNNAKVASHADRVDTIVIYLQTQEATEKALTSICKFHKTNEHHFGSALPKLVSPASVDGRVMRGVGTAMEPPDFTLVSTGGSFYRRNRGQSFGAYRAELIFIALERTRLKVNGQSEQQRRTAFKNRVEKYFRRAGINPDRPAEQEEPEQLPSIETIEKWTNTVDKKLV